MIKVHVDEDTYIEVSSSAVPGKAKITFPESGGLHSSSVLIKDEHIYKLEYALKEYRELKVDADE